MYFECVFLNVEITGKRHSSCALSEFRSSKGGEEEDVLTTVFHRGLLRIYFYFYSTFMLGDKNCDKLPTASPSLSG
jgi:hypothetical protein